MDKRLPVLVLTLPRTLVIILKRLHALHRRVRPHIETVLVLRRDCYSWDINQTQTRGGRRLEIEVEMLMLLAELFLYGCLVEEWRGLDHVRSGRLEFESWRRRRLSGEVGEDSLRCRLLEYRGARAVVGRERVFWQRRWTVLRNIEALFHRWIHNKLVERLFDRHSGSRTIVL